MKTIGILGGMSPESTVSYYKTLNSLAKARLGGYASAKILLHSVNFAETHAAQVAGAWDDIGTQLAEAAAGLEQAGADIIILATNTMHKCAPTIEAKLSVPFIHIAEACGQKLRGESKRRPALLGTAFTMQETFYTDRLESLDLTPVLPSSRDQAEIHRIIFDDLVHGKIDPHSQQTYIEIVERLSAKGADSVILGCTEIGMLLNAKNSPLPPFDTAMIHCEAAINAALA